MECENSSALLYNLKPDKSIEEVVQIIKQRFTNGRKQGNYYERELLWTIHVVHHNATTTEFFREKECFLVYAGACQSLRNLVQYSIRSLSTLWNAYLSDRVPRDLRHVIDSKNELTTTTRSIFQQFGMNSTEKKVVDNKSRLLSSSVLTELEKDENCMKEFREYVTWDDLIRSFALELHIRQHEFVQQQNARVET